MGLVIGVALGWVGLLLLWYGLAPHPNRERLERNLRQTHINAMERELGWEPSDPDPTGWYRAKRNHRGERVLL